MASSVSVSSVVLSRYANALIDLAEKAGSLENVQQDVSDLEKMIGENEGLRAFFEQPVSGKANQAKVAAEISKKAKFDKLTANFLQVLVENGRLNAMCGIISTFHKSCARRRGDISVRVETAIPLTKKQEDDFGKKISAALGGGILIETSVDPGILGGMIVTVGSHMVDDSVRRKLERLGGALASGVV